METESTCPMWNLTQLPGNSRSEPHGHVGDAARARRARGHQASAGQCAGGTRCARWVPVGVIWVSDGYQWVSYQTCQTSLSYPMCLTRLAGLSDWSVWSVGWSVGRVVGWSGGRVVVLSFCYGNFEFSKLVHSGILQFLNPAEGVERAI